jgi:hypothetical protein
MITDIWLIQFLTSDMVMGLVKPSIIVVIIGFMIYAEVKPRIERSDKVQL